MTVICVQAQGQSKALTELSIFVGIVMELVRQVIKSFCLDRPGHFQLTPKLAICDWSGRPAEFEKIKIDGVSKVICKDCRKAVTGDGEFSDLYHRNDSDHLGPTRSKLHDEGREKYARDLYVYEDKRKPKPRKQTGEYAA